jgi:hypothetical protein
MEILSCSFPVTVGEGIGDNSRGDLTLIKLNSTPLIVDFSITSTVPPNGGTVLYPMPINETRTTSKEFYARVLKRTLHMTFYLV